MKTMTTRQQLELALLVKREAAIRRARVDFYSFCKLMTPTFYTEEKTFLKELCNTLQQIYERKLLNKHGEPYEKILLSVPPRHGKTLTKDHFVLWVLGLEPTKTQILSASYGQSLSIESSRFIRNKIAEEKNDPLSIVYSDIFPNTTLSDDNKNVNKWSVKGSFFTYKATSRGGSATGMGTNLAVVDDLIKDHTEAFNEKILDSAYSWFTDTFLSREQGEQSLFVVIGTRWSSKDVIGRLLDQDELDEWYEIKLKAYDEEKEEMLCESILSKTKYDRLARLMSRPIFLANYQQEPVDEEGRLYKSMLFYDELDPKRIEKLIGYCDTADTGSDYLSAITAAVVDGELYVVDIYYTKDDMTITENELAKRLHQVQQKYDIPLSFHIEGNNGGSNFARTITRKLHEEHKNKKVMIHYFHQTKNKAARILSNASFIQEHVFFEKNTPNKFRDFYNHYVSFQRDINSNKHDDGVDSLTGLVEKMDAMPKLSFSSGLFS